MDRPALCHLRAGGRYSLWFLSSAHGAGRTPVLALNFIKNSASWTAVQTQDSEIGLLKRSWGNCVSKVAASSPLPPGGTSLETPGSALVADEAPVPVALSSWAIPDSCLPLLHAGVLGKAPAFVEKPSGVGVCVCVDFISSLSRSQGNSLALTSRLTASGSPSLWGCPVCPTWSQGKPPA